MKALFTIFLWFIVQISLFAQEERIRLFSDINLRSVSISTGEYKYELHAGENKIVHLKKHQILQVTVDGDQLKVRDQHEYLGTFEKISIVPLARANDVRMEPIMPAGLARYYEGTFEIEIQNHKLRIINILELENYVAGVVEAECGPKALPEFYKAQSIICRTYVLSHVDRHKDEGFNLCDDVHCQVYKGKPRQNVDIPEATLETAGLVLTDTSNNLIIAAFHSNCGGQTINSEDVWSKSTSYLRSVSDTFCVNMRNAFWEDSVPIREWMHYLDTIGVHISKSKLQNDALHFNQILRTNVWVSGNDTVPLKKIRKDFKFRSTFFSFSPHGQMLVFKGRGYGHGVGLCQEGAMQMAVCGLTYIDIIAFYYQNVYITHISQISPPKAE